MSPERSIKEESERTFATDVSRYTAVAVKDTPAFASVLGEVAIVFDGKLLVDGATYLGAESSCGR